MYSQNNEQQAILDAFPLTCVHPNRTPYRFLDIGAYDPKVFSNTRALYERGWSGVMFEPSPEPFGGLMREYGNDPRIKLVAAAVGLTPGLVKLHATADALSTTSDAQRSRIEAKGYAFHSTFLVLQMTLAEVFGRFGIFDFISIDVEGGSAELFLKLLEFPETVLPKCVCVEHDNVFANLEIIAAAHGYRKALRNGENIVFVRSE